MSIDGRKLAQPQEQAAPLDPYANKGAGIAAALIIWVPLGAFVVFTYWSGTFFGGTLGGLLSVVSTVGMIAVIYLMKRAKRG